MAKAKRWLSALRPLRASSARNEVPSAGTSKRAAVPAPPGGAGAVFTAPKPLMALNGQSWAPRDSKSYDLESVAAAAGVTAAPTVRRATETAPAVRRAVVVVVGRERSGGMRFLGDGWSDTSSCGVHAVQLGCGPPAWKERRTGRPARDVAQP